MNWRPPLGDPSKYLLTNLALCGCCRGPLKVLCRKHGNGRRYFYGCSAYHNRGHTVCANKAIVPMDDANEIVLEALLDDVLDESMIADAITEATQLLDSDTAAERLRLLDAEFVKVERERGRLVEAIASGGMFSGLVDALRERETRRTAIETDRAALRSQADNQARRRAGLREELIDLAGSWRRVLADDPIHARPIISTLLKGRVTFTPMPELKRWEMRGEAALTGLFNREIFHSVWRPQRDQSPLAQTRIVSSVW